jgi:glutaredoxin-like protein
MEKLNMEKLITEDIANQVADIFKEMESGVEIFLFESEKNCEYCEEIEQLIEEVSDLSPLIHTQVFDLDKDAILADKYHVELAPTLVILSRDTENMTDYGIRLLGAPAGHEFTTLIHDILFVSKRRTNLDDGTRAYLKNLKAPLLLQVFVTPTCPYCPQAVLLAHQMAMESDMVQAEMVESNEFFDLANRYNVSGVPQTTINAGAGRIVGAVPEKVLLEQIQNAFITE